MTTAAKKMLIVLICTLSLLLIAAAAYFFIKSPQGGPITFISDLKTAVALEKVKPSGKATSFVTEEAVHVQAEYIVTKSDFDDSTSCTLVAEEHARRLLLDEIASLLDEKTGVKKAGITREMIPALAAATLQNYVKEDPGRCSAEVSTKFEPIDTISDMLKILNGPFKGRDSLEIRAMALSALNSISDMTNNDARGGNSGTDPRTRYVTLVNTLRFARAFESGRANQKFSDVSDPALISYTEAIKANPNSAYAFYYRSTSHGRWKEALDDLSEAIRLAPDNSFFYSRRGNIMKNSSRDKAIEDFSNAIRLDPDNEAAYISRGEVYMELKKYDLAMRDFDKAISIRPEKSLYYNQRGFYYYRDNNFARALHDFDKAIELSPEEAMYYYNRATAYVKLGRRREAIRDFRRAIDLKGDFKEAERHIEELTRE